MRRALQVLAFVAVVCSAGCSPHWRTVEVAPTALATQPNQVRVTLSDGSRIVVTFPKIVNDSLFGARGGLQADPIAMPLVAVSRIAIEEPNHEQHAAVTLFVVTAAATFAGYMALLFAAD